ncbi:Short-chain dehydrogenase [Nocardioides scoriae]|uniref:Short-chain dehydrogenase n=1 Tax=Nocardioides scoriae TaxID=642780 RepID=A0A1H1YJB2_9ACTN|nr:SDR family NAD(P)-dependent oxidoreductase [Nocardioides scoriae]SDR68453.1 Short-chain dehydrogenase [Nocardioides scoriae]SDT21451.1 Short-chain dehydrogenase [Nocardioides scoriae]
MTTTTIDRVVMVVGATSGIGLAVAEQASGRGETVVVVARDPGRVEEVAAGLPGEALGIALDVVDGEAVHAAVETVVRRFGRLDAVVTTAQVMAYGDVEQVPPEIVQRVVDTAVMGTHHLARAVLPVFRSQGGGTLVVVSSLLAEIAVPRMGIYSAAKWGQLGLVRSLQAEVRHERDLHVCLVLPGAIDTPIYHQAATYGGSRGSAPPPVISPESVARTCLAMLERPRRLVHAGPVNRLAVIGFRAMPWVYDRVARPMVDLVALRGPAAEPSAGNVLEPLPRREGLNGGWTFVGRLRRADGRARWRRRSR